MSGELQTASTYLYATIPSEFAATFERDFPFGEGDHVESKTPLYTWATQFIVYIDNYTVRRKQVAYLFRVADERWKIVYGPTEKYKKKEVLV